MTMVDHAFSTGESGDSAMSFAQAEILRAILENEPLPWLPEELAEITPVSEQKEDVLEAAGRALNISDEAAAQGWQQLSAQLAQSWNKAAGPSCPQTLQQKLQHKFAGRLPAAIITGIGEKAQQMAHNSQASDKIGSQIGGQVSGQIAGKAVLDQMVACVQSVLTHLSEADLRVMARPMALAMRGNSSEEFVEATIQSVRPAQWEVLSPIEQARLSLAVARYAMAQIEERNGMDESLGG